MLLRFFPFSLEQFLQRKRVSGKAWGGVFEEATDRRVEKFTESVSFDRRLYAHDIRGSVAHAQMLAKVGLISADECQRIEQALGEIRREIEQGDFQFDSALEDTRGEPIIRIHPWIYDLSGENSAPLLLRVRVLPGLSPIRQALLARRTLPEQDLHVWEKISLQRIRLGSETTPPTVEPTSDVDSATRERALAQLAEALEKESASAVEHHTTGFGCILVAKLAEPYYLAFALGSAWPMPILEVHRMNRADGSTESIKNLPSLTAPNVPAILEVFRGIGASVKGSGHVDD